MSVQREQSWQVRRNKNVVEMGKANAIKIVNAYANTSINCPLYMFC